MYSINTNFNEIFKAISYKTRTDILIEINKNPNLTLTKLSEKFKMSRITLEFHIQKLKSSGMIKSTRRKDGINLSLKKGKINNAIKNLITVLELNEA
ncbi:MAG: winged helix-turn-helix domain-containing protein [Alphaproteobacteria bacterium]|nr:MAG: hypothetical protein B6I23_01490 [Rickettsiaceae bacterium 4572_127]